MPDESFWNLYWDTRLQYLQGQGKGHAILAASRLIRSRPLQSMRILELGCGEGQILGALVEAHNDMSKIQESIGVDYDPPSLETARKIFPAMNFIQGDFTNPDLLDHLGKFDLILLVNALHHVFSDAYDEELGEVDVPTAKSAVRDAFQFIQQCLNPGGSILLFDGLEADGDLQRLIEIRFLHPQAHNDFLQFASEYQPFRIRYQAGGGKDSILISVRDFTRYVTKMIFLGKPLWQRERLESYQYFNRVELQQMFRENGLTLMEEQFISVDVQRWQDEIEILSPYFDFPVEHVLMTGIKPKDLAG
ncbi:MAG: methyltransferase domain-containing protein [Anaerolineaceae bacterium]|nr:methyltransferase domain-containing protein [Anaerolineaceae bacterium]